MTVTDYISQFLSELSYRFNTVNVYICPGNHSRISPKKEDSLKGENIDHLAIPFLQAKLQNFKNIKFNINDIEESVAMFNVRGNIIMAAHGDKDSPSNVVQKFTLFFGIRPDIVYLGHRHTNGYETQYDVKVVQSGCLSGNDNYCITNTLLNVVTQIVDKFGVINTLISGAAITKLVRGGKPMGFSFYTECATSEFNGDVYEVA